MDDGHRFPKKGDGDGRMTRQVKNAFLLAIVHRGRHWLVNQTLKSRYRSITCLVYSADSLSRIGPAGHELP